MKKFLVISLLSLLVSGVSVSAMARDHHRESARHFWTGAAVYAVAKATFPDVVPPFSSYRGNFEDMPVKPQGERFYSSGVMVFNGAFSQDAVNYLSANRESVKKQKGGKNADR